MFEQLRADANALWDADEIVFFEPSVSERLGLNGEAVQLLGEVGLPRRVEYLFESTQLRGSSASRGAPESVCFGSDGGAELSIQLASGRIYALSPSRDFPSRFVNSSMRQFLEFLMTVVAQRRALVDLPEEAAQALIQSLVDMLWRIDAAALNDRDHWWAVIIEQMHDGLF